MKKEQKCKDEDDYKDYDKEKDAKRIIETLGVCYILGSLMTQASQVLRGVRYCAQCGCNVLAKF